MRKSRLDLATVAIALAIGLAGVRAAAAPPTPDEARGLVAQLAADLAREPSATAVLQRWCAERDLAEPAVIVAERQLGHDKAATAKVRALLKAAPDEPIRYRKVALACGRHVLSRADNWYRPGQLTPAMNAELETTDHPFGAVVRPLAFRRESLEAEVLMKPDAAKVPAEVIRNKALLETPNGTPFSLVVETYSRAILDEGPGGRTRGSHRSARAASGHTVVTEVAAQPPARRHRRSDNAGGERRRTSRASSGGGRHSRAKGR
jgi:hypothetical protein